MTDARDDAGVADGGDVAGDMVSPGCAEVDSADEVTFDILFILLGVSTAYELGAAES